MFKNYRKANFFNIKSFLWSPITYSFWEAKNHFLTTSCNLRVNVLHLLLIFVCLFKNQQKDKSQEKHRITGTSFSWCFSSFSTDHSGLHAFCAASGSRCLSDNTWWNQVLVAKTSSTSTANSKSKIQLCTRMYCILNIFYHKHQIKKNFWLISCTRNSLNQTTQILIHSNQGFQTNKKHLAKHF